MTELTPYELIIENSTIHPTGVQVPAERDMDRWYPTMYFHPDEYARAMGVLWKQFLKIEPRAAPELTPTISVEPAGLEARVKVMKGGDAIALARLNNLPVVWDAPNNGVLVMRCKNAAYHAIRKGTTLTFP